MSWFIFYVQTGKEQVACDLLNKLYSREHSVTFIPQIELVFKTSKLIRTELKPMFPGYVFTDSTLDEKKFIAEAYKYTRFLKCVYKLLGNNTLKCMKVSEEEKNFLMNFCNDDYIAEESKGFIVGDKACVFSGPLRGRESIIKKIDRHKRRAEIELTHLGDVRRISVAIEILSKVR